jgi:hypothetical protein
MAKLKWRRTKSAALVPMNTNNPNPDDAKLSSLLRDSRVTPALPPRFQENVWRRIADAETRKVADSATWLDALIAAVLRPRLAFAAVAALVILGALLGARDGNQLARHDAQVRYLASVAPNSLR